MLIFVIEGRLINIETNHKVQGRKDEGNSIYFETYTEIRR